MIEILQMKNEHLEEVVSISNNVLKLQAWSQKQFESQIQNNASINFVGKIKNEIVCFFSGDASFEEMNVFLIATKQNHQRKGYAQQLFDYVLAFATRNGIEKVFLEVSVLNKPALAFYKNMGFEPIRKRKNYYKDGSDCIEMKLEL